MTILMSVMSFLTKTFSLLHHSLRSNATPGAYRLVLTYRTLAEDDEIVHSSLPTLDAEAAIQDLLPQNSPSPTRSCHFPGKPSEMI